MRSPLALVPAAAIALAGCTGGAATDGTSASGTGGSRETAAVAGTTTTSSSAAESDSTTTTSTTSATTTTTTTGTAVTDTEAPVPTALPTSFGDVNQAIDDTDLKDSITVKRIARQLPWPEGYRASAQAYELVALEMTWTPSSAYTIPIRRQDFAVNSGSQFPNAPVPLVDDTIKAAGWALLPDQVSTGDPVTGWLVFKVDPRSAPKLTLDYTRPAAKVTGTSTSFPAKTFSVGLVG